MLPFTFEAHIPRTIFGYGTLNQIPDEIRRLDAKRVLLVIENTDWQRATAARVTALLRSTAIGTCTDAVMHTPEEITLKALNHVKAVNADCLLTVGGGSTIGLGKALSIRTGLSHIAVPTTYAGSEATPILGETVNNLKRTLSRCYVDQQGTRMSDL